MQEVAGERGGYLHGRGALDSDDLLYLKEQMEAEEDAERLLRRTEKRAFATFKKAATLADSSPSSLPLPLRVEPKPKSGIRQQDLLKKIVEIKPKRQRASSPSNRTPTNRSIGVSGNADSIDKVDQGTVPGSLADREAQANAKPPDSGQGTDTTRLASSREGETEKKPEEAVRSLLGLAYESSDDDDVDADGVRPKSGTR